MKLDLSQATVQEIVNALNLKIICQLVPASAQMALNEIQVALQQSISTASTPPTDGPPPAA